MIQNHTLNDTYTIYLLFNEARQGVELLQVNDMKSKLDIVSSRACLSTKEYLDFIFN